MFRTSWLVALVALATGCSRWVELGSTGEGTGGAPEVADASPDAEVDSGGSEVAGGAGGSPVSGTGGRPNVTECNAPPALLDEGFDGQPCTGELHVAEPTPVDVFLLMDRSVSVTEPLEGTTVTRWEATREAVTDLLSDPEVEEAGIRFGIQFFSLTGGFIPEIDCDPQQYVDTAVPITGLPEARDAILAAMDEAESDGIGGQTPTLPALQGAYLYAKQWAASPESLGRPTVVLLLSDGLPTQCQTVGDIQEVVDVAEEALVSAPSIRTFVISVGDKDVVADNLDRIARGGGTQEAIWVEGGSATAQLLEEFKGITLSEIGCEFRIPPPPSDTELIDLRNARMLYWPDPDLEPDVVQEIPHATQGCGSQYGGWYYDVPEAPTKLQVCPCTCSLFRKGKVQIQYGCVPLPA